MAGDTNTAGANPSTIDSDGDGLSDAEELRLGTDPHNSDTDGDTIGDGTELRLNTNPRLADSDGDGVGDKIEIWTHTDPNNPDTDGDGFSDGFEMAIGDHPRVRDLDGNPAERAQSSDELARLMEKQIGVTQHNVDSDGDGFADWIEAMNGQSDPKVAGDMTEDMVNLANPSPLDRFVEVARQQIGTPYQFGAEADMKDPTPTAFDSSELVQWTAHQAGVDMPDGSWNQYRYLHDQGASISVDDALKTKGALVFGFSSDPLASPDRPARAYVGISLGDGKVLDVSERAGEVREMDPGGFYTHAAVIPELTKDLDSDHDGMTDFDERAVGRDPYRDDTGRTDVPVTSPSQVDQGPSDGPVTSPDQVDGSLPAPVDDAVAAGAPAPADDVPAPTTDAPAPTPTTDVPAPAADDMLPPIDLTQPDAVDAPPPTDVDAIPPVDVAAAPEPAPVDDTVQTVDDAAPVDDTAAIDDAPAAAIDDTPIDDGADVPVDDDAFVG